MRGSPGILPRHGGPGIAAARPQAGVGQAGARDRQAAAVERVAAGAEPMRQGSAAALGELQACLRACCPPWRPCLACQSSPASRQALTFPPDSAPSERTAAPSVPPTS